jgi:hypothetical protein
MIANILIALAAGAASALMFASIVSGALVSLLLFYLAPLPLMVASQGWGSYSAAIGGIAAAGSLAVIFGLPYGLGYAIMVALPAWWLGHLALLGRPSAGGTPPATGAPALEWYPVGRILLWIAGFAVLTTMAALLTLGTDAAAITTAMQQGASQVLGLNEAVSGDEMKQLIKLLVALAPASAAIFATMTLTLNLWLGAKITTTSGRLHRPWPDLKSAAPPPMTLAALAAAIGFCFVGGLPAILAQLISAALAMVYVLTGLAVLHTLTLSMKNRTLWLCCAYAVMALLPWTLFTMMALGIADAIFGLRARYLQRRQPPPIPVS